MTFIVTWQPFFILLALATFNGQWWATFSEKQGNV
jgi:hypothetical protein